MDHSKEPWTQVDGTPDAIDAADADLVIDCGLGDAACELAAANARRICACINYCAGMSTEDLEAAAAARRVSP